MWQVQSEPQGWQLITDIVYFLATQLFHVFTYFESSRDTTYTNTKVCMKQMDHSNQPPHDKNALQI